MAEKQLTINELRAGKTRDTVSFAKSVFGGYSVKEVTEYIKTLRESLHTAEASFKARLEEYSAMTAMLTQERDKYKSLLAESESRNTELSNKAGELIHELETLRESVSELSESSADEEEIKRIIEENNKYKEMLKEHERYSEENAMLRNQVSTLTLTVEDLNKKLDEYSENRVPKEQYDIIASENELIKQKFDEIATEMSVLHAEKNILSENNDRLKESLARANDRIRELLDINTKTKLKARKIMAEYQSKAYECGQNHKRNIEQLSDNIKNALSILQYEQNDILKLVGPDFDELEIDVSETDEVFRDTRTDSYDTSSQDNDEDF
jgi:chromosome segregation ATPase